MTDAWPLPPPFSLAQCVERLPIRAQSKYADLKAAVADCRALVDVAQERLAATQTSIAEVGRRRAYAAGNRDAAQVAKLDAELTALHRKLDKLDAERARRNAAHASAEQLVSRLSNFVLAMHSGVDFPPPPPYPADVPGCNADEALPEALQRLRSEIWRLQGEVQRVRLAPLPAAEIEAAIRAEIARLAVQGRPRLTIAPGGKVELQMPDAPQFGPPGTVLSAPGGSASKLMCWLHGDKIAAELIADLPPEQPGAIASSRRPGLLADLEARTYALEIGEERLILEALAAGEDVQRRLDANMWCVLYETLEPLPALAAE
jgi:hypothetical protein